MEILILPGFSPKNKEWAYWVRDGLVGQGAWVHEWNHWATGQADFTNWQEWLGMETPGVMQKIKGRRINIVAKSIGTLVTTQILEGKKVEIDKLVLCGIPLNDIEEVDKKMYGVLKDFPASRLLIIQNENDNHGSFAEAEKFLHTINPKLKIISKPADNHEYPYLEEMVEFLG